MLVACLLDDKKRVVQEDDSRSEGIAARRRRRGALSVCRRGLSGSGSAAVGRRRSSRRARSCTVLREQPSSSAISRAVLPSATRARSWSSRSAVQKAIGRLYASPKTAPAMIVNLSDQISFLRRQRDTLALVWAVGEQTVLLDPHDVSPRVNDFRLRITRFFSLINPQRPTGVERLRGGERSTCGLP
jgi:hypothetical protein